MTTVDKRWTRLDRALSKLGCCSRREAVALVKAGRVRVNNVIERYASRTICLRIDQIYVDGKVISAEPRTYIMLNKPRGLVTTTLDEKGRETVFKCLESMAGAHSDASDQAPELGDIPLPRLFPVGRLDKASEGLLLFTNDTAWAAAVTDPKSHLDKVYHVQINSLADPELLRRMRCGVDAQGDFLKVQNAEIIRHGQKNSWIAVVLREGKNRHIRRLLAAFGVEVLRLIRIAVGPLQLGPLPKGHFRHLTEAEVRALQPACGLIKAVAGAGKSAFRPERV